MLAPIATSATTIAVIPIGLEIRRGMIDLHPDRMRNVCKERDYNIIKVRPNGRLIAIRLRFGNRASARRKITSLFAEHRPPVLLTRREFHLAKAPKCDRHQLLAEVVRVSSGDGSTSFPREVMMATIRKGAKQFTRWFRNFREANKPPYRWYEHGTYFH
jgi:hypothetical protein